ncbi:hypothetical protein ACFWWT_15355 [Streptomyces sp. NPDC058676]
MTGAKHHLIEEAPPSARGRSTARKTSDGTSHQRLPAATPDAEGA